MASQPAQLSTLRDYLQGERKAEFRSEYFRGLIFAMSGGTGRHSELSARVIMLLGRGSCRVFDSNLKIYLPQADLCVYPDASIVCGLPEYFDDRGDVLLNPILVVEVLSPSTERYDKSSKAFYYRGLSSLHHCLLISQEQMLVEHSVRQRNRTWVVQSYTEPNERILLEELEVEVAVSEIYRGILEGPKMGK